MSEGPDEGAVVIAFDDIGRLEDDDDCQGDHVFTLKGDREPTAEEEAGDRQDSPRLGTTRTQPAEQEIA